MKYVDNVAGEVTALGGGCNTAAIETGKQVEWGGGDKGEIEGDIRIT